MNKYFVLVISITLILTASSCQSQNDTRHLKPIGEKEYVNGFKGTSKYKVIKGVEYICHSELVTHKKIIGESLDGSKIYNIDLKPVFEMFGPIGAVDILDWDNIYVMPHYSTYIVLIDGNGMFKRKIDLSRFIQQDEYYELMSFKGEFIFKDTSMIFCLDVEPQKLTERYDKVLARDSVIRKMPIFIKIDNFMKDSLVCHLGAEDLYPRFSTENILTVEPKQYRFVNDQIIFTSMYSDSIYIINSKTLKVAKAIKIHSKYTGLIIDHLTREDVENSSTLSLTYNSYTNGYISNVVYDQLSHHYLVLVAHKPKNTIAEIMSGSHSRSGCSVIVLDSLFNQIDEIKLDEQKYNTHCLSTSKGLYLASNSMHSNDSNYYEKYNYTLFKYE